MPTVTLVLASGPGRPEGDPEMRYELDVALDPAGHLDPAAWLADPAPWPARRYWPGQGERRGEVLHDPDGGWTLRFFRTESQAPDAPISDVVGVASLMRPGEYVTIKEPDGQAYDYRIVNVA